MSYETLSSYFLKISREQKKEESIRLEMEKNRERDEQTDAEIKEDRKKLTSELDKGIDWVAPEKYKIITTPHVSTEKADGTESR